MPIDPISRNRRRRARGVAPSPSDPTRDPTSMMHAFNARIGSAGIGFES